MHAQQPVSTAVWDELRLTIDEAMNELAPTDRTALLLRFFESRSHGDVGAPLGLSENAARMRVERAAFINPGCHPAQETLGSDASPWPFPPATPR